MNQLQTVTIVGAERPLVAVEVDGKPHVSLRHACEALGIDFASQSVKLRGKSWACVVMITTQPPGDTQRREMSMIDRRTLTMWLATIDENRVSEHVRPTLIAYQAEAADALEAHFVGQHVRIEHQSSAQVLLARSQMELCQAAKGLIHPDHLEAKARIVLARGLGEHAELSAGREPLYTQDFLKSKNLSTKKLRSIGGVFGKRMKAVYIERHGEEPKTYPMDLSNGQVRNVRAYTEADRPLMEEVWQQYFAGNRGPLELAVSR